MTTTRPRTLIVGAGLSGCTIARVLADAGLPSTVIDRLDRIGGDSADMCDASGRVVSLHGFTPLASPTVAVHFFLARFTDWLPYEHRVHAQLGGRIVELPAGPEAIKAVFGVSLATEEVAPFLSRHRLELGRSADNAEELLLSRLGRELYEALHHCQLRRRYGVEPSRLAPWVAEPFLPRAGGDPRWSSVPFQALPARGWSALLTKMIDHPLIDVRLGVDFFAEGSRLERAHTVYAGPVDQFFEGTLGRLPYRVLSWAQEQARDAAEHPVELHADADAIHLRTFAFAGADGATTLSHEIAGDEGDVLLPVPTAEGLAAHAALARYFPQLPAMTFVGKLATFRELPAAERTFDALSIGLDLVRLLTSGAGAHS
jgi:UDP-galactopyranose mutase